MRTFFFLILDEPSLLLLRIYVLVFHLVLCSQLYSGENKKVKLKIKKSPLLCSLINNIYYLLAFICTEETIIMNSTTVWSQPHVSIVIWESIYTREGRNDHWFSLQNFVDEFRGELEFPFDVIPEISLFFHIHLTIDWWQWNTHEQLLMWLSSFQVFHFEIFLPLLSSSSLLLMNLVAKSFPQGIITMYIG